jgi:uncharacterized protein YjlB
LTTVQAHTLLLAENGWVPNNPHLPVILYEEALENRENIEPLEMETLFEQNAWHPRWRGGIYPYHHYHTTAHEALGIVRGSARLMLGGPDGKEIDVSSGHVLIIPVGVGHRCLRADDDSLVVGAYPDGTDWDLCKGAPVDGMRERITNLPLPAQDPVGGEKGLLKVLWRTSRDRA